MEAEVPDGCEGVEETGPEVCGYDLSDAGYGEGVHRGYSDGAQEVVESYAERRVV